ncbi:MAG: lysophospholipid acyltransferase family protein [Nitrospinales bacterium]
MIQNKMYPLSLLRASYRVLCLLLVCVAFTFIGIGLRLVFLRDEPTRRRYIVRFTRLWARCFCFFLNIRVRVTGDRELPSNALIVSNHVGSPDIFVLGSRFETFFVSKDEVRGWPLVGFLTGLGDTIFVDRSRRRQVPATIAEIQNRLADGFSVTLFPEGGATDGADVIPFKSSHFQAAVLAQRPVLPVMIHYLDGGTPSVACWYNKNFFSHMLALLQNARLEVQVRVLQPVTGKGDRRFLAEESRRRIREAKTGIPGRPDGWA